MYRPHAFRQMDFAAQGVWLLPIAVTLGLLLASTLPTASQSPKTSSSAAIKLRLQDGQIALAQNQTAEAEKDFTAVLSLDPNNAEANANLGAIAFFRNDCPTAEKKLRAAIVVSPSLAKPRALLGFCEKRRGDPVAVADLQRSFSELQEPNLRIQVGTDLTDLYCQQGNLDEALPIVRTMVDLKPDDADLLFFAQRIYSEMADETLNKLAVLAPNSARMQQVIAERLVNAGDLKGAILHYRNALAIDPHLPGMHFELAEALMQSAESDSKVQEEAESEFYAALKLDGDSAKVECKLGEIAYLRSDRDSALAFYLRAYQLNPKNTEALMGLARIEMQRGQATQAASYLRNAVDLDPLSPEAHYRLALAYRALQRTEEMNQQMQLFQEIKRTKEQIALLYREMNKPSVSPADEQAPQAKP